MEAIDYARGILWGHEGATDRERYDALRILEIQVEDRGQWPDQPFALDRERLSLPPKRRNRYAPRKGSLDSRGQIRQRVESNVADRWEGNEEVARLRARYNMPSTRFQKGQNLLKVTGLMICNAFGRVKGRTKRIASAWEFGTRIANILSKSLKRKPKSESRRYLDRAKALSDFVKRGIQDLAQTFFSSLIVDETERNSEEARKATAAAQKATSGFGKGRRQVEPRPNTQPARPPVPSSGQKALNPELHSAEALERALAEERLAQLAAGRGAGIKLGDYLYRRDRG
ncbi:hypothetical protein ASF56_22935 [Methylobacterium sp. Leaf122]|nr:hypothetical protein [Methylobacterium sp. Leaf122]KQQ17579.1 hypothetical protein ASF56_22935 [Methylobacterium sp. Leaf122]